MLSAGGVWGQAGGRGEAGRDHAGVGSQPSHHGEAGEAGGPADQGAQRPSLPSSGQLADKTVYCSYFLSRVWWAHLPSPNPSASQAWFLTKFSFQGHKEKNPTG